MQQPRSKIYSDLNRPLTESSSLCFTELLLKRAAHYPLAYLEGNADFFGREFFVNESVLFQGPKQEALIRCVLGLDLKENPLILDLGAGSGNIAATLAHEIPGSFVVALEFSSAAIKVLRLI